MHKIISNVFEDYATISIMYTGVTDMYTKFIVTRDKRNNRSEKKRF